MYGIHSIAKSKIVSKRLSKYLKNRKINDEDRR
jgi:hypothetical protein